MRIHFLLCLLVALCSLALAQSPSDAAHQSAVFAEFRKAYGEISAAEPALTFEQKTAKARALAEERLAKAG